MNVTINNDHSAKMDVSIPCNVSNGLPIHFYQSFPKYGDTAVSVNYTGAYADGAASAVADQGNGNDVLVTCSPNSTYAHFDYTIKNSINGPGYIYELPVVFVPGYEYTRRYSVHITYPNTLVPVSSRPEFVSDQNSGIDFNFDFSNDTFAKQIDLFVVFVQDPLPKGTVKIQIGNITAYALQRSTNVLNRFSANAPLLNGLFKKTLGIQFNKKIVAFVSDLKKIPNHDASAAMEIEPNVILFNDSTLENATGVDITEMFTHEITHALTHDTGIFQGKDFNAPWFNEGLAVFEEHYLVDSVLSISESSLENNQFFSSFPKFAFSDLTREYQSSFDYSFTGDTADHPLYSSYAHSGLVIYKLFIDDNDIIKKVISKLKDHAPQGQSCQSCDSDAIIQALSEITGKTRDDILFPFKNSQSIPSQYQILFRQTIATSTANIFNDQYMRSNSQSYFNDNTPVQDISSDFQKPVKTNNPSQVNNKLQGTSSTQIKEMPTQKVQSAGFFSRIKNYILSLFGIKN